MTDKFTYIGKEGGGGRCVELIADIRPDYLCVCSDLCSTVNVEHFTNPSPNNSIHLNNGLGPSDTATTLQREFRQDARQFGYLSPLNKQFVQGQQQSLRTLRARSLQKRYRENSSAVVFLWHQGRYVSVSVILHSLNSYE